MTSPANYVLDSNVFIEASRRYYAFDLVSSFWHTLIDQAENGRVLSIDRVRAEIEKGKDELADWAKNDFRRWFISTNQTDVIRAYGNIMIWANSQLQFNDSAKAEFSRAENADAWVIGFTVAKEYVVVTHEQLDPAIRRRVPIPNVCEEFVVEYVDTFQMLRSLGVRLS